MNRGAPWIQSGGSNPNPQQTVHRRVDTNFKVRGYVDTGAMAAVLSIGFSGFCIAELL